MGEKQNNMAVKRIVDVCMSVLLICLMAYQVTGEQAHEWVGIGMTALVIIHQILNRKWYGALFRGKYNAYRTLTTAVNLLLLVSFGLTAFCGMSMSGHAVPFLYGMAKVSFARRMHLSISHWAFVLMGLHIGLHIPAVSARTKHTERKKNVLSVVFCCAAGIGLFFFLRNGMPDYMLFKVPFAFLDYDKPGAMVFSENILMLIFWAFLGSQAGLICRKKALGKDTNKKSPMLSVVFMIAAVIIGLVLNMAFA